MKDLEAIQNDDVCRFYENVARVIHDINSPIATIEMGLCLLSKDVQSETLAIIRAAIHSIRELTQGLRTGNDAYHRLKVLRQSLVLSDVESVDNHRCNFKTVVEDVISEKRYEWLGKHYELVFSCSPSAMNANIDACLIDIKRMISNLLNNSIEACVWYAKINVSISVVSDKLRLSISDNGIGMENDKINLYLSGESSKHAGQGLGLSSAKVFMESNGGEICILSQVGVGTTIVLDFSFAM